MSASMILNARGVTKAYARQNVLNGVDLKIARGEFTVLLGKNGAGKSTLLRLVAGGSITLILK